MFGSADDLQVDGCIDVTIIEMRSDAESYARHVLFPQKYSSLPFGPFDQNKLLLRYDNSEYVFADSELANVFLTFNKGIKSIKDYEFNSSLIKLRFEEIEPCSILLSSDIEQHEIKLDPLGLYYFGEDLCPEAKEIADLYVKNVIYGEDSCAPHILVDYEKIMKKEGRYHLLTVVLLHEYMHALMDPVNRKKKNQLSGSDYYYHVKEEAMANAMTLEAIKGTDDEDLMTFAKDFIAHQPAELGYSYGLELFNKWHEDGGDHKGQAEYIKWIEEKGSAKDKKKETEFFDAFDAFTLKNSSF